MAAVLAFPIFREPHRSRRRTLPVISTESLPLKAVRGAGAVVTDPEETTPAGL